MKTSGRAEQIRNLTDYIEQTARIVTDVEAINQYHISNVKPIFSPLELYTTELAIGVSTVNSMLLALGGIPHYYDMADRRINCRLVGWHGVDPDNTAKQLWSVQAQTVNQVVSLDASVIDELRASYLY